MKEAWCYLFEGISGSGKTTLAKKLAEDFKIPYISLPRCVKQDWEITDPRISIITETVSEVALVMAKNFKFVWDRGWVSNIVYAKIFNRESPERYWNILKEAKSYTTIVFVKVSEEEAERRIVARGNDNKILYEKLIFQLKNTSKIFDEVASELKKEGFKVIEVENDDLEKAYRSLLRKILIGDEYANLAEIIGSRSGGISS